MNFNQNNKGNTVIATGILFLGFYLIGYIFPEKMWAAHYLSFLPNWISIVFIFLAGVLFFNFHRLHTGKQIKTGSGIEGNPLNWSVLVLAVLMGFIFYNFGITGDIFGDSRFIRPQTNGYIKQWDPAILESFVNYEILNPKIGTNTFYNWSNILAYLTGYKVSDMLMLTNLISGVLFMGLWVWFVNRLFSGFVVRIAYYALGITAPFTLFYYSHIEVYGPAYFLVLCYFVLVYLFVQNEKPIYYYLCILVFFISLKWHFTCYLLLPSLVGLTLYRFRDRFSIAKKLLNWKSALLYVVLPFTVICIAIYLLVTQSFEGPRDYTTDNLYDAIFLPVNVVDGPPYDRYSLFNPNHLLDYFNLMLTWSAAAVMIIVTVLIGFRKQVDWNHAGLILSGTTVVLYAIMFYILNPLLSMPLDWDLFSLGAPALLVFAVLLAKSVQWEGFHMKMGGPVLAICLLSIPVFIVNANREMNSERLGVMGSYIFKTYWIGSSTSINHSIVLIDDPAKKLDKRLKILNELKPYATIGNDLEYSELLCLTGIHYLDQLDDTETALKYFNEAYTYMPSLSKNIYYLVIAHFTAGQFKEAMKYTWFLTQVKYPNTVKSYRVAIHTALAATEYEEAEKYCREYLEKYKENDLLRNVLNKLMSDNPEESIFLFKQK